MSQQELVPEPQDQDVSGQPYRYKAPQHSSNAPKEEHPATFEETIPPYSYPAQDRVPYAGEKVQHDTPAQQRTHKSQQHSEDGDAFEMGYRPRPQYRQHQIPPWMRPQHHKPGRILRCLVAVGIVLLILKLLPLLLLGILGLLGVLASVVALLFIVLFGLLALALLIVIRALLGTPIFRGTIRSRNHQRWGRPWI